MDLKYSRVDICTLESKLHCNKTNIVITNNVRCKASRHFRKEKKEYLRAKIDELEIKSKTKIIRDLYRGISDVQFCYQPRTNNVRGAFKF